MPIPTNAGYPQSELTTYQAGVLQASAHRALKRAVSRFLEPFNLTMMQYFALGLIRDSGPAGIRLADLGGILQTTAPYTSGLVNQLEARGWVARQSLENDSRVTMIRLTDGSETTCQRIEDTLREKMRQHVYGSISPQELAIYLQVLERLSHTE